MSTRNKHKLLFIHGMGNSESKEEYDDLFKNIQLYYSKKKAHFYENFECVPVQWQEATYRAQSLIYQSSFCGPRAAKDLTINIFRPVKTANVFMTFWLGDVIAYTAEHDNGIRRKVWKSILEHCLEDNCSKYSILAHSLGSVIAFDFAFNLLAKGRQFYPKPPYPKTLDSTSEKSALRILENTEINTLQDRFHSLFTFGSPIGLFLLRNGEALWDNKKDFRDLINPMGARYWRNYYDRTDPIAYPLNRLFDRNPENFESNLEDVEISNPQPALFTHNGYWKNQKMAEHIANLLP